MNYSIETQCIHGGVKEGEKYSYGALTVPIYQTATFSHPGIGQSTGYDYSRESNPTRTELEAIVTALEGALDTVACSTGMGALAICLELLEPGSHVICNDDLYGGSVRIFDMTAESRNLSFTYLDTTDSASLEKQIQGNTRVLYIETPSNPTMKVTDLIEMSRLAKQYGLLLIVDNTFLSPYFQNPLKLGADIVIHSGTKFLGGHNDTLAGFLSSGKKELAERIRYIYKTVGSSLSPFDSFLLIRGIKTLAVRMEKQQSNAAEVAGWLKKQPKIEEVYYVGLPEHPGHAVNQKQASGHGSMISFRTDLPETARKMLEKVRLVAYAESLGGVESLLTYPMLQTHGDVPVEIREKLGITDDFLRLSIGIEKAEDIIADLNQALL